MNFKIIFIVSILIIIYITIWKSNLIEHFDDFKTDAILNNNSIINQIEKDYKLFDLEELNWDIINVNKLFVNKIPILEHLTNIITNNYVPDNIIASWNQSIEKIPLGWYICDGTKGTPNLIDSFILGSDKIGSIGGSNEIEKIAISLPEHKHAFEISNINDNNSNDKSLFKINIYNKNINNNIKFIENDNSIKSCEINKIPYHYKLIYIMKSFDYFKNN